MVFSEWPPDDRWLQDVGEIRRRAGIQDYELMGIVAFLVHADTNTLQALRNEPVIFLVDVGPLDIAEQRAEGRPWKVSNRDVYHYARKYQ